LVLYRFGIYGFGLTNLGLADLDLQICPGMVVVQSIDSFFSYEKIILEWCSVEIST